MITKQVYLRNRELVQSILNALKENEDFRNLSPRHLIVQKFSNDDRIEIANRHLYENEMYHLIIGFRKNGKVNVLNLEYNGQSFTFQEPMAFESDGEYKHGVTPWYFQNPTDERFFLEWILERIKGKWNIIEFVISTLIKL